MSVIKFETIDKNRWQYFILKNLSYIKKPVIEKI